MRAHTSTIRRVRWTGVVVSAVLLALWIGSARWLVGWNGQSGRWVALYAGTIGTGDDSGIPAKYRPPTIEVRRQYGPFVWRLERARGPWRAGLLRVPLWCFALPALVVTIAARALEAMARRRVLAGFCAQCGYDRAGLGAGAVCPECGEPPPATPTVG